MWFTLIFVAGPMAMKGCVAVNMASLHGRSVWDDKFVTALFGYAVLGIIIYGVVYFIQKFRVDRT